MSSPTQVSPVGPAMFGLGIIVAIAGATKLPMDGSKWPDTWPIFLVGAILSVAGITLWRMAEAKLNAQVGQTDDGRRDPLKLLQDALPAAQSIEADLEQLSNEDLCERVDQVLVTFILPAAEARQDVVKKLGMTAQMTVEKEFVEEQFGKEGFLFAPGFAETMLVIALAFVSIRRIK